MVLVRADGSAAWEEGPYRDLEVPPGGNTGDSEAIEVRINFNNTYIDNVTEYIAGQLQSLDV